MAESLRLKLLETLPSEVTGSRICIRRQFKCGENLHLNGIYVS